MFCLYFTLVLISTLYCNIYSAQHEKKFSLTRCELEWIEDRQQPSTPMPAFTPSLNKRGNDHILTLSNGQQYYNHPFSKQEFDLFLMQHVELNAYRSLYVYGTLGDQPISITMQNPYCKINSSFNKDHTKASIGLHLREQTPSWVGASSYEMTIKEDFELPLFAQNKTYSIHATGNERDDLTKKRDDFFSHYLCFNFTFFYKQRPKKFPVECYVSTVRALDKTVIIRDPSFYETKKKILLLLQAVQYIESSGTLSDEVQKLLQIKNDTSSPKILNNNTEALVELELEQRLNDAIPSVSLNDNIQNPLHTTPCKLGWIKNYSDEGSSKSILEFPGKLNKTDNNFILTLSDYGQRYNFPISEQEFDLLLMQHVKLQEKRCMSVELYTYRDMYVTLNDQRICINMECPDYEITSVLDKNHTKASIGLCLEQTKNKSSGIATYAITVKNNSKLPLFAQNKTYSITARGNTYHNLTTKHDDSLTHYLCFNFIFSYRYKPQKSFPFECYVSTVRALDKTVIISDPHFNKNKKKMLLLLQVANYIKSSAALNDNAHKKPHVIFQVLNYLYGKLIEMSLYCF